MVEPLPETYLRDCWDDLKEVRPGAAAAAPVSEIELLWAYRSGAAAVTSVLAYLHSESSRGSLDPLDLQFSTASCALMRLPRPDSASDVLPCARLIAPPSSYR